MEYLIGVAMALAIAGLAVGTGMDRDRSFAPVVMIVIAFYYVLFATISGSTRVIVMEVVVAMGFSLVAVAGLLTKPWIAPAAIIAHGLFDTVHHLLIENTGMPRWWPGFCMSIDIALGAALVALLVRRTRAAAAVSPGLEP